MTSKQYTEREKDIGVERPLGNYREIIPALKKYGMVYISTGDSGGINASWNMKVANNISQRLGAKVLCFQPSAIHDSKTIYIYQIENLKMNNKSMKDILDLTY